MNRIDFEYRYEHDQAFRDRVDSRYDEYTIELVLSLIERRQALKMTTQDLAYLSDISISTMNNIENFKQFPTFHTLNKLAKNLGVKIKIQVEAIE